MSRTMLLFDIDGTLVDAGGVSPRAMHAAAEDAFDGRLSFDGIDTAGRVDRSLFVEAAERNGFEAKDGDLERLRDAYIVRLEEAMRQNADRVRALPGTLELLRDLQKEVASRRDDAPVVGCLTGNFGVAAHAKLRATGFTPDWFTVTAFGDEAETRPELTELALKRYETSHGHAADPERVVVIGDTPHDIDCAHAHGCVAIAVATGRFSRAELETAGADHVVDDLIDPAVVLDYL